MSLSELKKCPPTVVFTSEFDNLRKDAMVLIQRLQTVGRCLDYQDMPGVQHAYHHFGYYKETDWFYDEFALAF